MNATAPLDADQGATAPLVVVHLLPRLSPSGGIQVVVRTLAEHLDRSAIDLHVVTCRPERSVDATDELPVTLHPLDFLGSRYRVRDRIRLMVGAALVVRRVRADVVQLHSGLAWLGLLARFVAPRTSFVLEVHDGPGSGRVGTGSDRFEGWLVRRCRVLAVCHSSDVEAAIRREWKVPPARIRRFPLGIDVRRFVPVDRQIAAAWRKEHGFRSESLLVVMVGRPAPSKRADLAVDVVARALELGVDAELLLIGSKGAATVESHVDASPARDAVHMWSFYEDLPLATGSCDVLLSMSEYEGFGLAIAEAMSCGVPVVATAVGGVTDLIDDGVTGYLVPIGDVDLAAERLRTVSTTADAVAELGRASRERAVGRFSVETMVAEFTRVYRESSGR